MSRHVKRIRQGDAVQSVASLGGRAEQEEEQRVRRREDMLPLFRYARTPRLRSVLFEASRLCKSGPGLSSPGRTSVPGCSRPYSIAQGPAYRGDGRRRNSTHSNSDLSEGQDGPGLHISHIALGSNLGDRKRYIQEALNHLDARGIQVINTSQLYESAPMYVEDQPQFLNAACCVMTTLTPHKLMRACQQIEQDMGRVKLIDKGARCIDLDILLYDDKEVNTADLKIPHIGIQERDFVYVPLSE